MMRKWIYVAIALLIPMVGSSQVIRDIYTPPASGAPPTVTSICATQGTTLGGTAVVLTGTGFANASAVSFGATSAGTNWWINSPTSITVSSPAVSAGVVNVRVTNSGGTSATGAGNQFTYVTPSTLPTVVSITPNNAPAGGGDSINIIGTNLDSTSAVNFGATGATFVMPGNATTHDAYMVYAKTPSGTSGTTVHITVTNSAGASVATCVDQYTFDSPSVPSIPATATRPSYNTGTGFFVKGRGIYDANGNLFTPYGVNREHFDAPAPDRYLAKNNIERDVVDFVNTNWTDVNGGQRGMIDPLLPFHVVPMPGAFFYSGGSITGNTALSVLNEAVTRWVNDCCTGTGTTGAWATTYSYIALFNIANEWGYCASDDVASSSNSTYRQGYVSAVQSMRTAGYLGPLVIDAGCSGQGPDTIVHNAVAIEAADPQHNVVFSLHSYQFLYATTPGGGPNYGEWILKNTYNTLAQLTVPVIIGEFSAQTCNGGGIQATPDQIIQGAEAWGMGWLVWSWDDGTFVCNTLGDNSNTWCYNATAASPNGRTALGTDVFTSAVFGMQAVSQQATIFSGSPPTPPSCP